MQCDNQRKQMLMVSFLNFYPISPAMVKIYSHESATAMECYCPKNTHNLLVVYTLPQRVPVLVPSPLVATTKCLLFLSAYHIYIYRIHSRKKYFVSK